LVWLFHTGVDEAIDSVERSWIRSRDANNLPKKEAIMKYVKKDSLSSEREPKPPTVRNEQQRFVLAA